MDPETATSSNADSAVDQLKQVWTLTPLTVLCKGVNNQAFLTGFVASRTTEFPEP